MDGRPVCFQGRSSVSEICQPCESAGASHEVASDSCRILEPFRNPLVKGGPPSVYGVQLTKVTGSSMQRLTAAETTDTSSLLRLPHQ